MEQKCVFLRISYCYIDKIRKKNVLKWHKFMPNSYSIILMYFLSIYSIKSRDHW